MPELTLTKTRIANGVWEGMLMADGESYEPALEVLLLEAKIEGIEIAPDGEMPNLWQVRFPIPVDLLSDGVQTFFIRDVESSVTLERFTLITGQPLEDDIRAEVDLLRSELDMLKSAFRRHCLEVLNQR